MKKNQLLFAFLVLLCALVLPPCDRLHAQVKLVGAKSRVDNIKKIDKLTDDFNKHCAKYRALVDKVPVCDIKNFEASDELAEMSIRLAEMIRIYNSFDEVEP